MRTPDSKTAAAAPLPSLPINYNHLDFLTVGGSGTIYALGSTRILKEYHDDGIAVERRVLQRLAGHANIVRCLGQTADGKGLVLERGRCVRDVVRRGAATVPFETKFAWLVGAAGGLAYMHEQGVVHADVGCHNWIVVGQHVKVIDFEGCSVDGADAAACYEWFSYREACPRVSVKTDIFAFGCAVYEVVSGRLPYAELEAFEDRMLRVKKLYAEGQFPQVEGLPLGDLMMGCWKGCFEDMQQVMKELERAAAVATKGVDDDYWDVKAVFLKALKSPGIS